MVLGQNLDQIRPNFVKKLKKHIMNKLFSYFTWEYLLQQKAVVAQILEQIFKANVARNATFEGHLGPNFCPIWVKNSKKKRIIFKNIILVTQS